MMKKLLSLTLLAVFTLVLSGCISYGQGINYNKVATIQRNVTTEADIRAMFGEPKSTEMNMKRGVKILTYGYRNSDDIKRVAAGTAGAVAGGALGSQVGGGSGRSLATGLGAAVGGFLASNVVTAREEKQFLEVTIGLKSQRVIDFNYIENKGRSQRIGFNGGVSPL